MAFALYKNFKSIINTTFLLLLCFFFTSHIRSPTTFIPLSSTSHGLTPRGAGCFGLQKLKDSHSRCLYLKTHHPCITQGYLNYLHIFYCSCGRYPAIGYSLLALWLLVLFYLLGNTASHYFCSSVENLSRVLHLSPTIAGVTLLSLGNGSPDVFASIVSFRSGSGEVGLSSVLGGAFFVSCVVVGVINLCRPSSIKSIGGGGVSPSVTTTATVAATICIDRASFLRDVCFFIFVLSSLLTILIVGKVTIWGSMAFTSLYFVYVSIVSATHFCREKYDSLVIPILDTEELNEPISATKENNSSSSDHNPPENPSNFLQLWILTSHYLSWLLYFIELPLYLPRRLTIPDVSEERWSRPFAVASAGLAPIFLATLWNSKRGGMSSKEGLTICLYSGLIGLVMGLMALHTTMKDNPPRKCLFPWLAGGFLMSVLWTYVIAEELVGLLVSLGYIFGISPSILGFTVLAWGNSIGDLIANVAMAMNGGQDGAQIAISGCYAGPIFNTLAGLGLSLVVSAWAVHPDPFVIPVAPALFEILGFMIGGLLWALVILPKKEMKLDRVLGIGLLAIYLGFLSLRLSQSLGLIQF
ncbi:cation/calcium exchanger 1-like [Phalaenopsis equestris]|uniref:cation/calcium exchanger 1-like n=1 Tax=Phalaenopsis equestris TaxID=78828 RepID=UPI0009E5E707|nr:cation/calcium exchanger 1-like [Phalaenopsis equestris]